MKEWILALLMALPAHRLDREPGEVREERMRVVAEAIEAAVIEAEHPEPKELALLLVTTAFFESGLALHVHEGRCNVRAGECDHGRAKGLWQLHQSPMVPREDWRQLEGTDLESTRVGALYAARILAHYWGKCKTRAGALSGYATGKTCRWKGAPKRVAYADRLRARVAE
jgi:hypothetical protein